MDRKLNFIISRMTRSPDLGINLVSYGILEYFISEGKKVDHGVNKSMPKIILELIGAAYW